MIPLVTKSDLDQLKYVADSVKNATSWNHFVSEAQLFDIKVWLGDGLLNEIALQATPSPQTISVANQLLLDGGTYTYQTKTYLFQGLKNCIIYYAFSRFTNRTAFNYTAAGIVVKDSDLSTPISDKIMQRLETESRLMADAIQCEIITFLNRNYLNYPLWRNQGGMCGTNCGSNGRIQIVGD
jgi:hypothetical protein